MGYKRISRYYPGEDGTRLAVDVYLPETEEKVPFLLKAGYGRRRIEFEHEKDAIERFIGAGYAVAIVEVRGSGASFGVSDGFYGLHDAKDLACIMRQLAKEPWCSGICGTYGGSNYGMSQEITAVEQPEPLRAIAACDCSMDLYDQNYPNGVSAVFEIPGGFRRPPAETQDPVDDDPEGKLCEEAVACHSRNLPFLGQYTRNMFRDDVNPKVGYAPNMAVPAWEKMDRMRFGHVASFAIGSWFDPGCTNKLLTYKSWGGRLLLGPWPHCGIYRNMNFGMKNAQFDWLEDHLRYFDHTVKGKDNGFGEEPPVRYYTVGDDGNEWKFEEDFPVEGTLFSKWHLGAENACLSEKAGPASSVNYQVRNDIMIYGEGMRMNRNVTKDMTAGDGKSLVFTSKPLEKPMEITGVPVLDLFVKSTHPDGNFIAVLEEVTPDGVSHFLTEGMIRGSHARIQRNNIYESLGLPYHRSLRRDRVSIPSPESGEEPLRLSFHLEVLSRVIPAGSRLRIAISCGGSGFQQPEGFPEDKMPTVTLYSGKAADSALTLPVVKPWRTHFTAQSGEEAWVFKTAVYLKKDGRFARYPVKQVFPAGKIREEHYIYETGEFLAELTVDGSPEGKTAGLVIRKNSGAGTECPEENDVLFSAREALPGRYVPAEAEPEIPLPAMPWAYEPKVSLKNLYVGTVPVAKGAAGNMNPMLRKSFDLYVDLIYPQADEARTGRQPSGQAAAENPGASETAGNRSAAGASDTAGDRSAAGASDTAGDRSAAGKYPVIVNIHGFGGSHHQFERNADDFLKAGYAVASIDYRLTPPCTWEAPVYDAKACIRYLKARAQELSLDPERFGIIGGSMGGYLSGMLAATSGDPEMEGDIGRSRCMQADCAEGTNEAQCFDSSVRASVTMFGPMDLLHFGDDCDEVWPGRTDKRDNGDGPFAPPASMIGYVGPGKGVADLKKHLNDPDPEYAALLAELKKASPISHVTDKSAPICLVHGMFDCGIQVPMGQSTRMFDAYTRKGVKALLLCNNNGMYGDDPEVAQAVVQFLTRRV